MATQEVFAAVAAVVSAFHSGADLVANIKRRTRPRGSHADDYDEAERKKLRVSLETGESQIGFRYAADMNKLGDLVRIGDDIARERILHIAIVIQTEIIMSLQLAVKYENAVVEFDVLHEASVVNRKDTIDALDELKQRILLRGPVPRNLTDSPTPTDASRFSIKSISSVRSSRTSINTCVPDNYMPPGVSVFPDGSAPDQPTALAQYFAAQAREDSPNSPSRPRSLAPSETVHLPPALEHLLQGKGPEERAAVMKDIDEIIAAYQGLSVENDRAAALAMLTGQESTSSKRDTLVVLNGGSSGSRDTADLNRDALRLLGTASGTSHENSEYPAQLHDIFDWKDEPTPRRLSDWMPHPRTASQASRWSTTSAGTTTSSVYSQNTISDPPSLYRYNSDSSRGSPVSPDLATTTTQFYAQNYPDSVYSTNTTAPFWGMDRLQHPPDMSSSSSRTNTPPAKPLTPRSELPPGFAPPGANTSRARILTRDTKDGVLTAGRTRVHLVPDEHPTHHHHHQAVRSPFAPSSTAKPLPQVPPTRTLATLQRSSASTGSEKSLPPPASEKMMDGRPCKDNNYWGFCKGAWATRESLRKGLSLETRPEGMYNTSQVWQCKHCHFEGASFPAAATSKTAAAGKKKELVVDPNVYVSRDGIRYRWIFLAKAHVKKKSFGTNAAASSGSASGAAPGGTTDGAMRMSTFHKRVAGSGGQAVMDGDCSFGCVVCSVEGSVTGIYGSVETLMNHIYVEHVCKGGMSEQTRARSKVVVGRVAGVEEEWDVNVVGEGGLIF